MSCLCGNSGGGPLSTFYMAQANTPEGERLTVDGGWQSL